MLANAPEGGDTAPSEPTLPPLQLPPSQSAACTILSLPCSCLVLSQRLVFGFLSSILPLSLLLPHPLPNSLHLSMIALLFSRPSFPKNADGPS